MSFVNARINECMAYGFTGGPEWSTLIIPMDNGREQRNGQWLYPKSRFSADYLNLNRDDQQMVLQYFHAMRGRLHCFRFRDWNDYEASNELQAPEIGTSTPMQLVKTYGVANQLTTRIIQAPVDSTVILLRDGTPVDGDWDYGAGKFTPSSSFTAGTYTASFQFDLWVRFDSDFNAFSIGSVNAHSATIDVVEVRR